MTFRDRQEAGQRLSEALLREQLERPIVLGLPRGGVPVAAEVARALDVDLDVIVVRKIGAPQQPELGMGAVAEGGALYLDHELIAEAGLSSEEVEQLAARALIEVEDQVRRLRGERPLPPLSGRCAVLVDDGVATGGTLRAAIRAVRGLGASRVVVAVPVGAEPSVNALRKIADEVVCLATPPGFSAVGQWYEDFQQVSDREVAVLLRQTALHEVSIPVGDVRLDGTLSVPENATGIVIFAHGSGSSRFSPRNRFVAQSLQAGGLATLLFDLLTREEEMQDEATGAWRFNLQLLAGRLMDAAAWLAEQPTTQALPIGYFGSSTGAGAALMAAAMRPENVRAIVSRGGRPDLAGTCLAHVQAPTLFIVGGADGAVLSLNERAARQLPVEHDIAIVPGATHLFEEPGALEEVARIAADWFREYLVLQLEAHA